mgnify:CR=1 FL=1
MVRAREEFIAAQPELDALKLVFVDETWAGLAMSRNYGWSPEGEDAVIHRQIRGKKLSVIGAMAMDGERGLGFVEGGVNGEHFVAWIHEELGPNLHEGDLVVMDNLRVHKMVAVREALESYGAKPLFLPAYSPELNPIELIWGAVKNVLRGMLPRYFDMVQDVFREIWETLPSEVFARTVRHCGYAASC